MESPNDRHRVMGGAQRQPPRPNPPLTHERLHGREDGRLPLEEFDGRVVELEEIKMVCPQPLQAALQRRPQVGRREVLPPRLIQTPRLGCEDDALPHAPKRLAEQLLAVPVAVEIRRVVECHTKLQRAVQRTQ